MTGRWSDVELVRFCEQGVPPELMDSVIAALRDRLHETASLRLAVIASPQTDVLRERLGLDAKLLVREAPVVVRRTPAWVMPAIVTAAVVAAFGGWQWSQANRPGEDQLALGIGRSPAEEQDRTDQTDQTEPQRLAAADPPENAVAEPDRMPSTEADRPAVELTGAQIPQPAVAQIGDAPAASPVAPDAGPAASADTASVPRVAQAESNAASPSVAGTLSTAAPSIAAAPVAATGAAASAPAARTAAAEVPAVPEPVIPDGPWARDLNLDLAPRRFADVAWLLPGMEATDEFPPDRFREWCKRISGRPFQPLDEAHANRLFTRFDGEARLMAPWPSHSMLRLGLYDVERCSIVLWNGNEGVRLRYYHHLNPKLWCANRVTRSSEAAPYELGEMLNCDIGRWQRAHFGTLDVRWDRGVVRLLNGDAELLQVPLAARPTDVDLEGRFKVREMRMVRAANLDESHLADLLPARSVSRHADPRPTAFEWTKTAVECYSFSTQPEAGTITLAGKHDPKINDIGWASIPATAAGLSEFIFRVDEADAGTGVYLGNADGQPVCRLTSVWDPYATRSAWALQLFGERTHEQKFDRDNRPEPWSAPGQWLKVMLSQGMASVWVSADGENWGLLQDPRGGVRDQIKTIGVFALPGADRHIRLSHVEIRDLPMLASLADPALVDRVPVDQFGALDLLDVGAWTLAELRTRPRDIDPLDWRRACAIATLKHFPSPELSSHLIAGLLADGLFDGALHDVRPRNDNGFAWKLLAEATLLSVGDYHRTLNISQLYHEVARLLARFEQHGPTESATDTQDEPQPRRRPYTEQCMTALLLSPYWSSYHPPLTPLDAASLELTQAAQSRNHAELRQLIEQIIFRNSDAHPARGWWSGPIDRLYTTIAWSELTLHESLTPEEQAKRLEIPNRWKAVLTPVRHPMAQPVSKEAYNVMAEFQAAISGQDFNDACKVVASAGATDVIGLLPDALDDRLLISFTSAVALAMEHYPQLRASMHESFGAIGRLRVRQAIESSNPRQIEAATVQFYGTLAAAESERWLGDRAMSGGEFDQAKAYYLRALSGFQAAGTVEAAEIQNLQARIQLVNSMLGRDPFTAPASAAPAAQPAQPTRQMLKAQAERPQVPDATTVSFGTTAMSGAQLKQLGDQMVARARAVAGGSSVNQATHIVHAGLKEVSRLPDIAAFKPVVRGKYEGDLGERPGAGAIREVDWVDRQLAVEVEGPLAYLSNRFQVGCMDLTSGQMKWSQPLGNDHGYAHHWPLLAMRPVVSSDGIYCRRLTKTGSEIVCCQKSDGAVRWKQQPQPMLVSDPFLFRGQLMAVTTEQVSNGPTQLFLITLQKDTGDVVASVPVLRLFDAWRNGVQAALVTEHDGQLLISAAGVIACCSGDGTTQWVRQRDWRPNNMDEPLARTRAWTPPIVDDERVIVEQFDGPGIDCLDVRTGRLLWHYYNTDVERIVGLAERRLFVMTRAGIEAISVEDGSLLWTHPAADLLAATAVLATPTTPETPPAAAPAGTPPASATASPKPGLVVTRAVLDQEGSKRYFIPTLVWLNAEDGSEIARAPLRDQRDEEPRLGPFIVAPDRIWALFGRNFKESTREILELVPDPTAAPQRGIEQPQWALWHPLFRQATFPDNRAARPDFPGVTVLPETRPGLDRVASGWAVIMPNQPKTSGLRAEHAGQTQVLALNIAARGLNEAQQQSLGPHRIDAIHFVRHVTIPDDPAAALKFNVGHDKDQQWVLNVEADGERLHTEFINNETAPNTWRQVHISTGHLRGRTVPMVVSCQPVTPGAQTNVYINGEGFQAR